jgi:hypothetical protein
MLLFPRESCSPFFRQSPLGPAADADGDARMGVPETKSGTFSACDVYPLIAKISLRCRVWLGRSFSQHRCW